MFDNIIQRLFKKKVVEEPKLNETLAELREQTQLLKKQEAELDTFLKTFIEKIAFVLEEIRKSGIDTQSWAKEFHRLMLNEYSKYPQNRVYALLYLNTATRVDRRLMLIATPTFEKAKESSEMILQKEGFDSKQWLIEGYQSIEIPMTVENVVDKVDAKMFFPEKPHGVFVNDLKYVRESFTSTPTEKKTINSIIKRIEDKYSK